MKNKQTEYKDVYVDLFLMIKKDYGKRCKDFEIQCCICQRYLMLDILRDCVEIEKEST